MVNFYAGQGFIVRKSLNMSTIKQLDGATIPVETGSTLEKSIADYNQSNHVKIATLLFERPERGLRRHRSRAVRRLHGRCRQRCSRAVEHEEAG